MEPHVGLRAGESIVDQPTGRFGTEVGLSTMTGGDDRKTVEHGLGHGQTEAFTPTGGDQHIGDLVEGTNGARWQIAIDQGHVRGLGVIGAPLRQLLFDPVVWIGKGLDDEGDVVRSAEPPRIGAQQRVDPLAREARGDVQELEALRDGRQRRGVGRVLEHLLDAQPDGMDGDADTIVDQHARDVARHGGGELQVLVEAHHALPGQGGLFPTIAAEPIVETLHPGHPRRVEQPEGAVRGGVLAPQTIQASTPGVEVQEGVIGREIAGAFGRVETHATGVAALQRLRQGAVDDGEAIAAVEGAFDPVRERLAGRLGELGRRKRDLQTRHEATQPIV